MKKAVDMPSFDVDNEELGKHVKNLALSLLLCENNVDKAVQVQSLLTDLLMEAVSTGEALQFEFDGVSIGDEKFGDWEILVREKPKIILT